MNLRLSPSKYQCYVMCPLKFKFQYIDKKPTIITPHLAFGSIVHDTIESIEKLHSNKKNISTIYTILDDLWDPSAFDSDVMAQECKQLARAMLRVWLRWYNKNQNKLVYSEKWIELDIQDVNVLGKIDRVEETPNGNYCIIDYKTGRDTETIDTIISNIQLNIYAMGIQKLHGVLPKMASLFYLKSNKIVPYSITVQHIKEFEQHINYITNDIKQEKYTANPGKHCGFCQFADICEFKYVENQND